ncbi:MAG TPA: cytochrome C oxidase subunit II [Candidatus Sulfotelmatobacter sp.]|nr:cytochrome C oxidase subunit II [Candidatus Sulfotelmatobacter sp.]
MAVALRIALVLITLGCVCLFILHPLWFPAGASTQAALLDHDFYIAFWVLGALFIAGQVVLAWVLKKRGSAQPSRHWYGNGRFEIGWTLAIAAIFFWFHISGGRLWSSIMHPDEHAGQLHIDVTGAQFQWYFRYAGPDGIFGRTDAVKFGKADEGNALGIDPADPAGRDDIVSSALVVPVGHDIQLNLRAQDVVHSLFIPAMRFKQDAVPGMEIHTHFTPIKTGTYEVACAELCGLGHYRMRAAVHVVSEEEFEKWLKSQSATLSRE